MKKFLIKKIYLYIVFAFIIFVCPLFVNAESLTYDETIKMVKEVMKQYYIRGSYMQYNYAKGEYYDLEPEDATLKDNKYTVCAGFTHNVYNQAFGIRGLSQYMSYHDTFKDNAFPQYNFQIVFAAQHAYQRIKDGESNANGRLLLYYQSTTSTTDITSETFTDKDTGEKVKIKRSRSKVKYVYGDTNTSSDSGDFQTLVDNVQPGDLVVYTGHALIVYDKIDTNNDKKADDVLILNATGGGNDIISRIASTAALYYTAFPTTKNTSMLDLEKEGVVRLTLLSSIEYFGSNKVLKCTGKEECAVIRPFYKGTDNNAVFNFKQSIDKNSDASKETALRTKYSGLFIEKTVSKGDNNSVYLGDELTYTIKITNKSYVAKDNITYSEFTINEKLGSYVECVDCSSKGWTVNDKNLTQKVSKKLAPGETIELQYTVKVKDNLSYVGNTITSIGSIYDKSANAGLITTGTVDNFIIRKVNKLKKSYSSCFNENESKYSGLKLIDAIYICATGKDYNFDSFNFNNLFVKTGSSKSNSKINFVSSLDDNHIQFKDMIYKKYFNGLTKYVDKETGSVSYFYPRHNSNSVDRTKVINSIDFKDGDVLIYDIYDSKYTFEKGVYAYIYINDTFVGVNGSGKTLRNSFSMTYHTKAYWDDIGSDEYLNIAKSLYEGDWSSLSSSERKFIHYQSLYGKDNYVILRPELVMREVSKIEVSNTPTKTSYIQNFEELNLSGGKIKVSYNDGTTETINMNDANVTVTGFNNSKIGTNSITVSYGGETTKFNVNIVEKSIKSLNVSTLPTKLKYIQNFEALNLYGGYIAISYNDNSGEVIPMIDSNVSVKGFSNTTIGSKTITLTYKGMTTTFNVEIVEKSITGIVVNVKPTKTSYIQNYELLNLSGGKITASYNEQTTEIVDMTNSNVKVTGFNNSTLGTNTLTVTYKGKNTTFNVSIVAKSISGIIVLNKPTKTTYIQNFETLSLSGGKIKATYNDTSTETIDMTNSNVKVAGFNNSILGTKTLTVTYKNKTTTFNIYIVDKLSLKDSFINTGFRVKENFVYGFILGDLLSSIKNKVKLDYESSSDGIIATGVEFKYSSEILTAVVYGDLNGDGKINSADLLKMRQHLLGTNTLKGAYKEAAMVADGTTINSANLLRLRQHLLGQKLIEQ